MYSPVDQEKLYRRIWEDHAPYRKKCHSLELWENHREIFPEKFDSALDIGCGTGRILPVLVDAGIDAWGIDITAASLDPDLRPEYGRRFMRGDVLQMELLRRFDLGICVEFLEHLPPDKVCQALRRIQAHCDTVIIKVPHFASTYKGQDLHLTIEAVSWWEHQFAMVGGRVERLDLATGRKESIFRWFA